MTLLLTVLAADVVVVFIAAVNAVADVDAAVCLPFTSSSGSPLLPSNQRSSSNLGDGFTAWKR